MLLPKSEFFHYLLKSSIIDIFNPIMISMINSWYKDAKHHEESLRKIIIDNVELAKSNKHSSFVAFAKPYLTDKDIKLIESFQFEFVKKYTTNDKLHITKEDLFFCIFISVARFVYNNLYLLIDSDNNIKNIKRRQKLLKKISKAISKGIDKCLLQYFLFDEKETSNKKPSSLAKKIDKNILKNKFLGKK